MPDQLPEVLSQEPARARAALREVKLARPEGFEPPTPWFVAKYSIQMSYGRVCGRESYQYPA